MNAIILLAVCGVIMMLCSAFVKNTKMYKYIALAGIVVSLAANVYETYYTSFFDFNLHNLFLFSKTGLFFNSLVLFATLVYFIISVDEIEKVGKYTGEYFTLIFFVLYGIGILTSFNNLLIMFLGVEIMSIPLYILTGADKRNLKGNEAALKYFLISAFTTGVMIMGITLIYGGTGTFQLLGTQVPATNEGMVAAGSMARNMSFLDVAGMLILMCTFAFKVSAAPFHFWTPDVYDGAPSVFTSFMSTIVKVGSFIAFYLLFSTRAPQLDVKFNDVLGVNWHMLFAIIIFLTLLVGNVTAVFQYSVKRMLAYSSIAQAGFMLFVLFSLNQRGIEGLAIYAIAYSLATVGIFAVLMKLKDYTFDGFNGFAKKQPILAATAVIFLLSLTGIPLTAGFFAKYFMLSSAMQVPGYTWLVIAAVLFAAISAYYYFKVIQAMYFKKGEAELNTVITPFFKWSLVVVAALIIVIGIWPQQLLNYLYF